jgi:hypothetical protein
MARSGLGISIWLDSLPLAQYTGAENKPTVGL